MKSGKIILGVLAGLAAGAALGILFAPDKGKDTRKKISKKSRDFADDITNKMNDSVDRITQKFENLKESISISGNKKSTDN